ncbi:protein of unknown function [Petrocella atlantisensis]|uniref:Uncharacterized protein n=1 Tax=Petrocella atlantisensis TaxID=2173034 RepID=A0A3P7PF26_9FIRM|nr:protein of unknown function [Petrocella atlantisensis]
MSRFRASTELIVDALYAVALRDIRSEIKFVGVAQSTRKFLSLLC